MAAPRQPPRSSPPTPRRKPHSWYALAFGAVGVAAVATWLLWQRAEEPGTETPPAPPATSSEPGEARAPPTAAPLSIEALKAEELRVAEELNRDLPDNARAMGILGNVYSGHGSQLRAMACWEKALTINPKDPSGYDAMARVAFLKEDLPRAIELWRKAAELDPRFRGVYHHLGQALMLAGRTQEAIEAFTRDLSVSPRAFESHFFLGQIYSQMQDPLRAKQHYERAIAIEPRYSKAYYGLAMAHARLGEQRQSQEVLRRFSELKSKDVAADIDLRAMHDDVESFARRMAAVLTDCGEAYIIANDARKAEALWRRAAELDRTATASRDHLARLLQQTRREKEALALGLELCALEPTNPLHVLNVGVLQLRGGDRVAAERSFQRGCELAPDHSDGFRLLAQLYLDTEGMAAEALRCAQKAVDVEPIAPNFFVLGAACIKNGDLQKAGASLDRAIALDPRNPEYRKAHETLTRQK